MVTAFISHPLKPWLNLTGSIFVFSNLYIFTCFLLLQVKEQPKQWPGLPLKTWSVPEWIKYFLLQEFISSHGLLKYLAAFSKQHYSTSRQRETLLVAAEPEHVNISKPFSQKTITDITLAPESSVPTHGVQNITCVRALQPQQHNIQVMNKVSQVRMNLNCLYLFWN